MKTQKILGAATALLLLVHDIQAVPLPAAASGSRAGVVALRGSLLAPRAQTWRRGAAEEAARPVETPSAGPTASETLSRGLEQVSSDFSALRSAALAAFDAAALDYDAAVRSGLDEISKWWSSLSQPRRTQETIRWPERERRASARPAAPELQRIGEPSYPSRVNLVIRGARAEATRAQAAPVQRRPCPLPREIVRPEPAPEAAAKTKLVLLPSLSGLADLSENQDKEGFRPVNLAESKDVWVTEYKPQPAQAPTR